MTSHNMAIESMSKQEWRDMIKRIMDTCGFISGLINPKELFEIDLTLAQVKALICFSGDEELSMSELSRRLGVGMPTMTGMADQLVKAKLADRRRDSTDRRVVKIWLTDSGKNTLKTIMKIRRREMEKILVRLNREEQDGFCTALESAAQLFGTARGRKSRAVTEVE